MKTVFVGNFGRNGVRKSDVKSGFVTSLGGSIGTILFNDKTSAYFRMADGCHVSFDTNVRAVKFTSAIDVKRPDMQNRPNSREVVAVINRFNPDWVYVWAYPMEYIEALDTQADFQEALDLEAEVRAREMERQDQERRARALEQEILNSKKQACRQEIDSPGFFRIAQAHKFREEVTVRPPKPATGPMKLFDLIGSIAQGKVAFCPSQPRGCNDTLLMWFEKQVGETWVKVDLNLGDAIFLLNTCQDGANLEEAQTIIARLASVGIANNIKPSNLHCA